MTNAPNHSPEIRKSADNARQGVTNHNVRYVLAASLIGVILAFLVIAMLMG